MTTQEPTGTSTQFPRGFDSWRRAHFEVASFIQRELDEPSGCIKRTNHYGGCRDLSNLAENWTNKFEQKYKDQDWEKLDWLETIIDFCEEENQQS